MLIVAQAEGQAHWFEDGLFERAKEELRPAVRMVTVWGHEDGREPAGAERELKPPPNQPLLPHGELIGIPIAIVGTIVAIAMAVIASGLLLLLR